MTSKCPSQISGTSCDFFFFSSCQNDRLLIIRATWSFLVVMHRDIFILASFFPSLYLVFDKNWGYRTILKHFYIVVLQVLVSQWNISDSLLSESYATLCIFKDYYHLYLIMLAVLGVYLTMLAVCRVHPFKPSTCQELNDNPNRTQKCNSIVAVQWSKVKSIHDNSRCQAGKRVAAFLAKHLHYWHF